MFFLFLNFFFFTSFSSLNRVVTLPSSYLGFYPPPPTPHPTTPFFIFISEYFLPFFCFLPIFLFLFCLNLAILRFRHASPLFPLQLSFFFPCFSLFYSSTLFPCLNTFFLYIFIFSSCRSLYFLSLSSTSVGSFLPNS
jgi:hypothetical protein